MKTFTTPSDILEIVDNTFDDPKGFCQKFEDKRVLITGACGFLGRYFVETLRASNDLARKLMRFDLLKKPCEILAMDNLINGQKPDWADDVTFINHDITIPFYPERPIDYVLHAAGIASPQHYRRLPIATLEVATKGFQNILAATTPTTRIVYFSSSEIYGDPSVVPTPESYRGYVNSMGPRSCYDESKRLGETLAYIHHDSFDRQVMVVRPFNVYGPGMSLGDYRVLPNFLGKIIRKEPLVVYVPGTQTRTFCYVTDAIRGFFKVLVEGKPGQAYNIGIESPEISMLDLVSLLKQRFPEARYETKPHPAEYPPDEPQRRCPDITKAISEVGYDPRIELPEGLERFIKWALENYEQK